MSRKWNHCPSPKRHYLGVEDKQNKPLDCEIIVHVFSVELPGGFLYKRDEGMSEVEQTRQWLSVFNICFCCSSRQADMQKKSNSFFKPAEEQEYSLILKKLKFSLPSSKNRRPFDQHLSGVARQANL